MQKSISFSLLSIGAIASLTVSAIAQNDPVSTTIFQESVHQDETTHKDPATYLKSLKDMAVAIQDMIAKVETLQKEAQLVSETPVLDPTETTIAAATEPSQPPAAASAAEVQSNDAFAIVASETTVLQENTPDWVKKELAVSEDGHTLAISSSLFADLEECREDLKTRMLNEVQAHLDKHVLMHSVAHALPELTPEYVEKVLLKKGQEFDNVQVRPSGTYHQLYVAVHISAAQLKKIKSWEKRAVRETRVKQLGVIGGVGVAAIALFSGSIGVLARREKATLQG